LYFFAFALMIGRNLANSAKERNVSEGSFSVHTTMGSSLMYDLIAVFFLQTQEQQYDQMHQ
jgi:hypothetical protein